MYRVNKFDFLQLALRELKWSIALMTVLCLAACGKQKDPPPEDEATAVALKAEVIYGNDDRHEFFEEPNLALKLAADSTAALLMRSSLEPRSGGPGFRIKGENYGSSYGLCNTEKFHEQDTVAFCSGFLVTPTTLLTAGHCITNALDCSEVAFVFGFRYDEPNKAPREAASENVFYCKSIVHRERDPRGADFAVIELDRPVSNRLPLAVRTQGTIEVGEAIAVAGHPVGLPLKIAGGASVRTSSETGYFVANLDTFGGNSGSAVFNLRTMQVEGILVRGETDFEATNDGCVKSVVCANDKCRGEDVTRVTAALPWILTRP